MLAAQSAKSGIRPDLRGEKPLDKLFDQLMTDSRVTFFLMPLPQGSTASSSKDSPASAEETTPWRGKKRELPQQERPSKKGKGKGKDKKKGKDKDRRRHVSSDGSISHTRSGKPLCSDFNGNGCRAGVMKAGLHECSKGLHLCNAPKCTSRASHGRSGHTAAHE